MAALCQPQIRLANGMLDGPSRYPLGSPPMSLFTVTKDGEDLGQMTADQIEAALEAGTLATDDLVWSDEHGDWVTIAEAFEIEVEQGEHSHEVDLDHVPDDVVESAAEVDSWDAAFDDTPAGEAVEEAPVEMSVTTPKRSSFAAGWVAVGLLAVGSLVLVSMALPAMKRAEDSTRMLPHTKTARTMMRAILLHAGANQSNLPATLEEVGAEHGMPPVAERDAMPKGATGEGGYNYLGAGLKSDQLEPDAILFESKWLSPGRQAVVGFANGDVEAKRVK
jgi:hypothetical protein